MYNINLLADKPDIGYMEQEVDKLTRRGIRLADCKEIYDRYADLQKVLEAHIYESYGIANPRSAKQIVEFMKGLSYNVEIGSRNDILNICYNAETQKWTTNGVAFQKLVDLGYDFAKDILDYRKAKKYGDSVKELLNAADDDNLIHPTVSLAKTHRISYSKPALMNIPKALLWSLIKPFKTGNKLFSVDIKNQEPSILINMTGAEELKPALMSEEGLYETLFKQCFKPVTTANVLIDTFPENRVYTVEEIRQIGTISPALYSSTRPMIMGYSIDGIKVLGIGTVCLGGSKGVMPELPSTVPVELENGEVVNCNVTWDMETVKKKYKRSNDYEVAGEIDGIDITINKVERNEFKTAWLAISYGAGALLIKESCRFIDGKKVYKYITSIAPLKEYRSKVTALVKSGRRTINTIFGTPMYAGDGDEGQLKRSMLDLPIQGSAADILSLLIKRFYDYTDERDLDSVMKLYYTRHDELIIEIDREYYEKVGVEDIVDTLHDMLEHQINDWVPFKIEVTEVGKELSDLYISESDGDDLEG